MFFSQVLRLQQKLAEAKATGEAQAGQLKGLLAEHQEAEHALRAELRGVTRRLQQASSRADSLQGSLDNTRSRVHSLERELAKAEAAERHVKTQLGRLCSVLRRGLGLRSQSPAVSPQQSGFPERGQLVPGQGPVWRRGRVPSCLLQRLPHTPHRHFLQVSTVSSSSRMPAPLLGPIHHHGGHHLRLETMTQKLWMWPLCRTPWGTSCRSFRMPSGTE